MSISYVVDAVLHLCCSALTTVPHFKRVHDTIGYQKKPFAEHNPSLLDKPAAVTAKAGAVPMPLDQIDLSKEPHYR